MTQGTLKRNENYRRERQRALRKKRIRKRKLIRLCVYTSMFVVVIMLFVGMSRILVAKEASKQEDSLPGNTLVMEEDALIKPTEAPKPQEEKEMHLTENPLLVNKEYPLPEDYEVELITLPDGRSKAAEEAYGPLMEMLDAGAAEGLNLLVCSSYRDRERQEALFDEDVEVLLREGYSYKEAYEEVAKETMPPGCSEHSTGLAFDIVARDYQMLDKGQEKTDENKWLRKHCAEYGFILRYPKGKEDITGISYESWHFRYVGKEVAEYIMNEGLTLEEYLEKLNNTY